MLLPWGLQMVIDDAVILELEMEVRAHGTELDPWAFKVHII